jgi:proteasome lid subunit RPN8/RPN11
MLERIKIDGRALSSLREIIHAPALREQCGFLLGTFNRETAVVKQLCPVTNAAGWSGGFAIADYEHRRIERLARRLDLEVVGVYHSHPGGDGRLSEPDKRCLSHSDLPWMIIYPVPAASDVEPRVAAYAPPFGISIPTETVEEEAHD